MLPDIVNSEFNWIDYYSEVAIKGGKKEFERFSEHLDIWRKVNAPSPEKSHFVTVFSDITKERKLIINLQKVSEVNDENLEKTREAGVFPLRNRDSRMLDAFRTLEVTN